MFKKDELYFLAGSEDFDQLLEKDAILQELCREKQNRSLVQKTLIRLASAGKYDPAPGLTGALWVYLWSTENSFTCDFRKITPEDTEIFSYLLHLGRIPLSPEEASHVPEHAHRYWLRNRSTYPEAASALITMLRETFQILDVLPAVENSSGEPGIFDLYWLTDLCCISAMQSNHPLQYVMFQMPLELVFHCYISYLKKFDRSNVIRKRTHGEKALQILERVRFLGEEFCRRYKSAVGTFASESTERI